MKKNNFLNHRFVIKLFFYFFFGITIISCEKEEEIFDLTFDFSESTGIPDQHKNINIKQTDFFDDYKINDDTFTAISINLDFDETKDFVLTFFFNAQEFNNEGNYKLGSYKVSNWLEYTYIQNHTDILFVSYLYEDAGEIELLKIDSLNYKVNLFNIKVKRKYKNLGDVTISGSFMARRTRTSMIETRED